MRHFHGSVPVWFRGDSTLLDPLPLWKRNLRKLSLNWVYRFVDRAFYVGQANKRYFLWCGLKEDQLTYAPHAVDNEFFMKDDEERREEALQIRKDLGIDPLAPVFLFVGKLEPIKQPIELAESFASLDATAHLIYVGSGVLEIELKERFDSNPNIHFVGFQNQSIIPIWYRVGNVLCLPSKSETWGLAVNEALACGCSVIVSDRVGCAEDLVEGTLFGKVIPTQKSDLWREVMQESSLNRFSTKKPIQHIQDWNQNQFCTELKTQLI
jgi:glycosyltransferase involved in cell wall biosynthesis